MSSSITLSAATRQNLLSLQDTASLLSTTQSRLSTGKKVNSALDNPTNFFTSQGLTARSGDLSALLDGISNGIQTIQSANQGITSITKLLDTAKSTASQALADKTGGGGGVKGGVTSQAAKAGGTAALSALGTKDAVTGTTTFDLSSPTKDASLEISLDGSATKTTIRLDSTTLGSQGLDLTKVTTDQLLSSINAKIGESAVLSGKVKAAIGDDGRLAFTTNATGANAKVSVAGSASATVDIGFGIAKAPPKAATVTASAALAATTDFSNGASAKLTVFDGAKTLDISLDKDSILADGVTKLGQTPNRAQVAEAINRQLGQGGSTATVSLGAATLADGVTANPDANKLVFTSSDAGPDAQLSVVGGADTTAGGIGFSTFTMGGSKVTAPTELPASASTSGTLAGTATTAAGNAGAVTFGQSLGAAGATVPIADGLSTTFTITSGSNTRSITIDKTALKDTTTPLGNAPTNTDVLAAINLKLTAAGLTTVTASRDATTNALTFTDSNQANAAPVVATSGGTNADKIGLFATPTSTSFTANFPATFDFSGSNAASFTIGGKTVTLNASSPVSGNGTLAPAAATVSGTQVLDAINTSLKSQGSSITAALVGTKLTFVEGDTTTTTALPITGGADTTGAAFFSGATTTVAGTAATATPTASLKATTTAANAATIPANTAAFGTGGHTTFQVQGAGGTATVTIDANSTYDNTSATLGTAPDQTKLLGAINKQLTTPTPGFRPRSSPASSSSATPPAPTHPRPSPPAAAPTPTSSACSAHPRRRRPPSTCPHV